LAESAAQCRARDDTVALAEALYWVGNVAHWRGEYRASIAVFEECLALSRRAGLPHLICWALYHLSETYRVLGQLDAAARYHDACLRLAERHDFRRPRAYVFMSLGRQAWRAGDDTSAAELHREGLRSALQINDQRAIAQAIEGLAWIASRRGRAADAAWLLGALERLTTASGYAQPFQDFHDRAVAAARARLGEARFRAAWAAGQSASVEDAVAAALDTHGRDGCLDQAAGPLTRRERQVAELIAQGRSNREIAQELVIAERTVATHIEHILEKLGFGSRLQVGLWAAEQGLVV
jgi:non-specific serine/threonine protein kinase